MYSQCSVYINSMEVVRKVAANIIEYSVYSKCFVHINYLHNDLFNPHKIYWSCYQDLAHFTDGKTYLVLNTSYREQRQGFVPRKSESRAHSYNN